MPLLLFALVTHDASSSANSSIVYPVANPFKNESENKGCYSYSMRCKLVVGHSAVKLNMEGHLNKKRKTVIREV